MSGANQIVKFARVNREEQLAPLSAIGTEFHQRVSNTITAAALTAAQFATDQVLTAATPNALTGPTAVQMCTYFQTLPIADSGDRGLNPTAIGSRFEIVVENQDAVNPKVITLGAGFTPATVTIAPSTTYLISYELTAVSPQTWELFMQIPTTGAGGGPAGVASWQQSAAALAAAAGTPGPRIGVVTALPGDYMASDIPITAIAGITGTNVQTALAETYAEKVTLRDVAGAVGTGAAQSGDILLAIAPGDQYVPSNNNGTRAGHIGAILGGISTGATAQTTGGAVFEALGSGAIPLNGLYRAVMGADHNGTQNYSLYLGDAAANVGAPGFGQEAGEAQSIYRAILPAGLPGATDGVAGAYAYSYDNGAAKIFFVNSLGNVRCVPTALAGDTVCNFDINDMLTDQAIPSTREVKEDIQDAWDSSWLMKTRPRTFQYKEGHKPHRRAGLIIEELQDIGAPYEAFVYNKERDSETGRVIGLQNKPAGICWEAFTVALIREVQKLREDVERLKSRRSKKE